MLPNIRVDIDNPESLMDSAELEKNLADAKLVLAKGIVDLPQFSQE